MVDVPDDMAPADGLTDSRVIFSGLNVNRGKGTVTLRFKFTAGDDDYGHLAEIQIPIRATDRDTLDEMLAKGYLTLRDYLRQWLFDTGEHLEFYAIRATTQPPQGSSPDSQSNP